MEFLGIELAQFSAFMIAVVIIIIAPGPDMFFILSRSISGGRRLGFLTTLGILLGVMFHIFLAALGISSILMASSLAFQIVKYIGAVYLIYLGVKSFREKSFFDTNIEQVPVSGKSAFIQGAITNVFNPKVALFFLTFLPQFVNENTGNIFIQFVFLGFCFAFSGFIFDLILSFLASSIISYFAKSKIAMLLQQKISGAILVILGLFLALENS